MNERPLALKIVRTPAGQIVITAYDADQRPHLIPLQTIGTLEVRGEGCAVLVWEAKGAQK